MMEKSGGKNKPNSKFIYFFYTWIIKLWNNISTNKKELSRFVKIEMKILELLLTVLIYYLII